MPSAAALRLTLERSLERRFPAALTPAPRALREVAATGIAEVDAYLEGGLPIGAISELTGPQSSGRTSLALAFLARRTAEGRACAWVDAGDAFDPESAAASGVILPQLLWVRCRSAAGAMVGAMTGSMTGATQMGKARAARGAAWTRPGWTHLDQALRAADLLLQAGGFASIVLDLGDTAREQGNRIPLATWFRFRQAADRARSSLLVLGRAAYAQSAAEVVLACRPARQIAAGKTALRGFAFEIERRRERFAPLTVMRTPDKKPPVSTWTAGAAWDTASAPGEIDCPINHAEEQRA
jgi:recombination protein RecA